jgi:hypothetical protein
MTFFCSLLPNSLETLIQDSFLEGLLSRTRLTYVTICLSPNYLTTGFNSREILYSIDFLRACFVCDVVFALRDSSVQEARRTFGHNMLSLTCIYLVSLLST